MQKEYKVSIILPTYNGSKYIKEAVESILGQTYKNWELIIVDDCSTDNTFFLAKEFEKKDERIKVIHNSENKKLPESLNIGFRESKGELLTWTSDDNILKHHMLEVLAGCFIKDKLLSFVYGDIVPIDSKGKILTQCTYINGEIEDIYVRNPVSACFMYTREVYEQIGDYNKETFLGEDYDYWVRIYEAGFKMEHLKEKLYYYRLHKDSLTSTKRRENLKLALKNCDKNLKKEKRTIQQEKIRNRIKSIEDELNNEGVKSSVEWLGIIHDMTINWLLLKQENKSVVTYFEKHGYQKVALYGCKQLAECLATELKNSDIQLLYGLDRDRYGVYTESYKVCHPDDEIEEVDIIVVTAISHFAEIKEDMIKKVTCPIVSLEEIIDEVR